MGHVNPSNIRLKMFDSRSDIVKCVGRARNEVIRILICGPTVYDYMHIGHARMLLTYDLMCRYLDACGRHTRSIVNVTDIDPKVFGRAKELHTTSDTLATKFICEMLQDAA